MPASQPASMTSASESGNKTHIMCLNSQSPSRLTVSLTHLIHYTSFEITVVGLPQILKTYCSSESSTADVIVNDNNEKVDLASVIAWSSCDGGRCVSPLKDISEGYKGEGQREGVDKIPG